MSFPRREVGLFLMAAGIIGYFYFSGRNSDISIFGLLSFVAGFILLLK